MTVNQISAFLENREGQLSEFLAVLANNGIDLKAINIAETTDYGIVRIIADDPRKAAYILCENDYIISTNKVFVIEVPDQPGGLQSLISKLTDEDVDIEYMYSIFGNNNGKACMVIAPKDVEKMEKIAEKYGF